MEASLFDERFKLFSHEKSYTDGNYNYVYHLSAYSVGKFDLNSCGSCSIDIDIFMVDPPKPNTKVTPYGIKFMPGYTKCATASYTIYDQNHNQLMQYDIDNDWGNDMLEIYGQYSAPKSPSEENISEFIKEIEEKFGRKLYIDIERRTS